MKSDDENINSKALQQKELSANLYKLCFDDTDEFVDFYFRKRYSDEQHIAISKNDIPVAALQIIPYSMTFFGENISVAYLSAICTHPDCRNQGLMNKLLIKTHKQLFKNEICITTLIPAYSWLFDVYKKTGYETIFYRTKTKINTRFFDIENNCKIYEYSELNKKNAFEYFNKKMNVRNCCIQHSFDDFEIICEDIKNSKGVILIAECENKIAGISFVTQINNDIIVLEHFAETEEITKTLLKNVSEKLNSDELIYMDLPSKNNNEQFGMLRIICAEKTLRYYAKAHPNCKKTIFVKDDIIAENTGCYIIDNAQCKKYPLSENKHTWNIKQLTQFIFAKQTPHMSLMLNE